MKSRLQFCSQTAVAALLVGLTAQAAQAQPAGEIETVTVTGFRASLANALERKQTSNVLMESVTPEDIGKMPDKDVAESLQRLPGVQIDRSAGEGTQVRIRGLSYNITLLDGDVFVTGREMYTAGEGSGSGNGNQFQNSLEGIPSSLIAGIDVYKSPQANLVAGALGGTVDLRVRSALDGKDGLSLGGNAGMSYSQGGKKATPGAALVAQYKFSNNFGILAALSYDEHDVRVFEAQSQNRGNWTLAGPTTGVDDNIGKNYYEPELSYLTNQTVDRKRLGTFLGADYNPVNSVQMGLTWFHSFLTIDRRDITNKMFIHSNGEAQGLDASKPFNVDPNGVVLSGTFLSHSAEGATLVEKDKNIGDNVQFNVKYDDGGKFRASGKFAWGKGKMNSEYAQADFRQSGYNVDSGNRNAANAGLFTGNLPGNHFANWKGCGGNKGDEGRTLNPVNCDFVYTNIKGLYPSVSYDVADLMTNPQYILFKSHWGWDVLSKNDQWSAKFDAAYDVLDQVTASAGIRHINSTVDYDFGRYLLNAYGNGTCSFSDAGRGIVAGVTACPAGQGQLSWETDQSVRGPWTYYQDPDLPFVPVQTGATNPERLVLVKDFFPAAGMQTMLAQDPKPMAANPMAWLQGINPNAPIKRFKDAINSFKIGKKVTEGYFMFDIGKPSDGFHINTGVRVVHTQLDIGQYSLAANPKYVSTATWNGLPDVGATTYGVTRREYTDILPSLNTYWDVFAGHKLRFTAARVMADMNPWQLGAGQYYNFTRDSSGGAQHGCNIHAPAGTVPPNPLCDGFYFNSGSAGNNQLDPYRANQMDLSWEYYFGSQGLLSATLFWKGVESFTTTATVSTTVMDDFGGTAGGVSTYSNGRGGRIEGIELNAQYAFENGFGFNANYTYAQSKTANATAFSDHLPFPGVARNAYTIQAYYENGPVQGRVSYTWKGSALDAAYSTFSFPAAAGGAAVNYGVFDRSYGQVDAQLSYDIIENLGVVVEGRNLTGSATSAYLQYKNLPFLYDQAGRSYAVNLRFSY
jgi:iron complex outermembrane recepter protein